MHSSPVRSWGVDGFVCLTVGMWMVSFEYACLVSYEMVSSTLRVALLSTVRIVSFLVNFVHVLIVGCGCYGNNTSTVHSSPVHSSEIDHMDLVFIKTIRRTSLVSEMVTDYHNSEGHQDAKALDHDTIIVPDSRDHKSHDEGVPVVRTTNDVDNEVVTDQMNVADNHPRTDQDVDDMGVHTEDVHIPVEHKIDEDEMITHEQNATDQDVDDMEVYTEDVHISGEHKLDDDEMTTHEQNATDKVTFTQMTRKETICIYELTYFFQREQP
ncbi:hypothetical protein Bca4012_027359 [Brassica carinata]